MEKLLVKAQAVTAQFQQESILYERGTIYSAFPNAVNILLDGTDELITIQREGVPYSPNAIFCNLDEPYSLKRNSVCTFEDDMIKCGSKALSTASSTVIDNRLTNLSPPLRMGLSAATREYFTQAFPVEQCKSTFLSLILHGRTPSEDLFSKGIKHLLDKLNRYIEYNRPDGAIFFLNEHKGFGRGLTPETDDFFIGLFAAYIHYLKYFPLINMTDLLQVNNEAMNIYSTNVQRSILGGFMPELLMDALAAVSSEETEKLAKASRLISNYGHSSGEDMLSGILFFTAQMQLFLR
ncbi:DUF2877 domain-containing protein [bacterium]|nr:DUF2877 domain-containing protein [bacterium]